LISRTVHSLQELQLCIPDFAAAIRNHRLILFKGELGSGKTTLIRHLCSYWGVEDPVSSPTFSIVQIYKTHSDETINHIDLYRLKDIDEAMSIGIEEYLEPLDGHTLIEWPGIIELMLPESYGTFEISIEHSNSRKIVFLETII